MTVEVPVPGSDRIEARPGIGIPPTTSPSELRCPKSTSGTSLLVVGHHLDRGELGGLVVEDPAGQSVADAHLNRCRDRRDGESDDESEPVVAVGAPAQHPDRVDGGDHEAADQVGRDDHVGSHQRHRVVEDHPHRVDVGHLAGRVEGDALGEFIQALAATTEMLPKMPATAIGTPVQKWAHGFSRRQPKM